jgi:CxxC motif-containing protein (DUF1111 family)
MHRPYPVWCLVAAALVLGPVGWRVLSWERPRPLIVQTDLANAGQILFNHEWEANDPLCPNGDGLGPVFNARSCAACHHQNGPGGSGSAEHNVTTFLVQPIFGGKQRQGVVHTFATAAEFQETLVHVDPSLPPISQPALSQIVSSASPGSRRGGNGGGAIAVPSNVRLSQRNTPALFGVGLIESIPDQAIIANQHRQRLLYAMAPGDTDTVPVGRVARLADGRIGRFGWKAQIATLSDFVQAACANELGLGNPGQAQPKSMAQWSYSAGGLDLTEMQCNELTAFVTALPRPKERLPVTAVQQADVHSGKTLFAKVGCAECHTPSLGSVDGLYSDLLLHRMGTPLEGANAYYGSPPPPIPTGPKNIAASEPLPDEWRTPPLWGVANSAPYLHDGRAATLEEAIQLHGGQASGSASRFGQLGSAEKFQLIAFLQTLQAP